MIKGSLRYTWLPICVVCIWTKRYTPFSRFLYITSPSELVFPDIPLMLLSCTYFSSFFAASAWAEESSKSNTTPDFANSVSKTHEFFLYMPTWYIVNSVLLRLYTAASSSTVAFNNMLPWLLADTGNGMRSKSIHITLAIHIYIRLRLLILLMFFLLPAFM